MHCLLKPLCLLRVVIALACTHMLADQLSAHPIPKDNYDRKIEVSAVPGDNGKIRVTADYRLEIDEYTAYRDVIVNFSERIDVSKYKDQRAGFYKEFTKIFSKIIADNINVQVNGRHVALGVTEHGHSLKDEKGESLGHLRCDFKLMGEIAVPAGKRCNMEIEENNFQLKAGKIDLALLSSDQLPIDDIKQPSEDLKKKTLIELGPDDERQLRIASGSFRLPKVRESEVPVAQKTARNAHTPIAHTHIIDPHDRQSQSAPAESDHHEETGLLDLIRDSSYSIWLLLILSGLFGAVHALTPGHGKTLVAAYLVGEEGTVFHALVLGLVTTITHTGIVILIAIVPWFLPEQEQTIKSALQGVQIIFGLLIVCIGAWLLLCRLSGRADHFHIGGGHHHHHGHEHHHHAHGHHHHHHHDHDHLHHAHHHDHHHDHSHADHEHDERGNVITKTEAGKQVGWWRLVVLGMQGGIVPCWDAVAMLFLAVGMNLLWLALPMLLAFSAGLAGVLVSIGILVVYTKQFAQSRWGESRFMKALPIVSACIVIGLGMWLCYDSVHGLH